MTLFDIVVGLILIFSLIKGLINGFVVELASVLALVLGLLGAVLFCNSLATMLNGFMDSRYTGIVAFIFLFLVIAIAIHFIAKALDKVIEAMPLSFLNRIAGGVFAIFKTVFFVSIFVNVVSFFDKESFLIDPGKRHQSYLYEPVKSLAPLLLDKLDVDSPFRQEKESNNTYLVLTTY